MLGIKNNNRSLACILIVMFFEYIITSINIFVSLRYLMHYENIANNLYCLEFYIVI